MNLSHRQNCRNSKPPLGPSLQLICVDQLTTVGSGMRLAPADSNLMLRWRFSSPEGRFGSDYNQNASGLLPGGATELSPSHNIRTPLPAESQSPSKQIVTPCVTLPTPEFTVHSHVTFNLPRKVRTPSQLNPHPFCNM
jgi:hypothetical protein